MVKTVKRCRLWATRHRKIHMGAATIPGRRIRIELV